MYLDVTLHSNNYKCLLYFQVEKEQEKTKKIEESKCCMVQQLQECMEQNRILIEGKAMVEQNNRDIILEVKYYLIILKKNLIITML